MQNGKDFYVLAVLLIISFVSIAVYTMPIQNSTSSATTTTRADIIKP